MRGSLQLVSSQRTTLKGMLIVFSNVSHPDLYSSHVAKERNLLEWVNVIQINLVLSSSVTSSINSLSVFFGG